MPVDLPEPRRPSIGSKDPKRYWELCIAFLMLVAIYSLVHKAVIPIFLRFAGGRAIAIDFWFIHPWLLYFGLRDREALDLKTSFLAGTGIAHGVVELIAAFNGQYAGWTALSHLLSSLPIGLVCVSLLTGPVPGKREIWGWAGAVAALTSGLL